jgi:hypothetical protein
MEEKLKEVHQLLGRTKLNAGEEWMFQNYWDNPLYEFRCDAKGKLSVHKI